MKINELVINNITGFSFGAFSLGWIWGIGNGVFLKTFLLSLLAYILLLIPIIGWIAAFAIFIYMGKKGYEWAKQGKVWISQDVDYSRNYLLYCNINIITLHALLCCR